MLNFFNKNLFRLAFLSLILAEGFSFFGWIFPVFNHVCYLVILFLALILSLKKLEYGLYIIFAELFVTSYGYLFSFKIDQTLISLRVGLFLIIMSVWLMRNFKKIWQTRGQNIFKSDLKFFYPLFLLIWWALVWGLARGNNFGNLFLDFNNWLYFLLVFPVTSVSRNNNIFLKNILTILIAAVFWLGIKSLFLLYVFSHQAVWALPEIYKWVRDTRVGEIAFVSSGFYRIFIQSQIYSLLAVLMVLPNFKNFASQNLKTKEKRQIYLFVIVCLTTIILSFSRSYWLALVLVSMFYYLFIFVFKNNFLAFLKSFVKMSLVVGTSLIIIFVVINLPPNKMGKNNLTNLIAERAVPSGPAGSSRLNQLKPLLQGISRHPLFGSGFGTTLTYRSDDPRVLGNYTTYSFELSYLDMILKFGLIGLGTYLYLIYQIFKRLLGLEFKNNLKSKFALEKNNYLKFGLALALAGLLVVNFFSPYLNHPLGIGFLILTSVASSRV